MVSLSLLSASKQESVLEGYLPRKQRKRAETHIFLHKEELLAMWNKAATGINPGKLMPTNTKASKGDLC